MSENISYVWTMDDGTTGTGTVTVGTSSAVPTITIPWRKLPTVSEMIEPDNLDAYELAEAASGDSADDFAYTPDKDHPSTWKLNIKDATHARLAVQAITGTFRGNKTAIPADAKAGVKAKIAGAIRKFFDGEDQKYYLSWLHSGHKPDSKPVREMISFNAPAFKFPDEPNFPEVPFGPGVDVAALISGDPDPLYVIRPLGVLNEQSENGLIYDETLLSEIATQVIGKPARQGHVKEEDRSSDFPDDVGIWVGVQRQGPTLYGRCYIYPNTHFNEMVRKRKAAGGSLSNSIWGKSAFVSNGNGTVRSAGLELESVDFVPAERASLDALGGEFQTTAEMTIVQGVSEMASDNDADDKGVAEMAAVKKAVAEMQPDSIHEMLSEAQRDMVAKKRVSECTALQLYEMMSPDMRKGCAEMYASEVGQKLTAAETVQVAETAQTAVAEMKNLQTSVAEMEKTIRRYEREEFDRAVDSAVDRRLDWKVTTPDGEATMAALKKNLRIQLIAEMAGSTSKDDIEPSAEKAWAEFKPLAEMGRAKLAGPAAFVGVGTSTFTPSGQVSQGYDPQARRYEDEAAKKAAAKLNLLG